MARALYAHALSGNAHKVRLLLSALALPYDERAVNIPAGEQTSPDYLRLNPLGQVPVLIDGEDVVRDSQAILVYLAGRYDPSRRWWPADALGQAEIMRWLSFAANEIQNGLNRARLHQLLGAPCDLADAQALARRSLAYLDEELTGRTWLTGARPTIADCAIFPYVALAEDGGVALHPHARVAAWTARVKAEPWFVSMPGL